MAKLADIMSAPSRRLLALLVLALAFAPIAAWAAAAPATDDCSCAHDAAQPAAADRCHDVPPCDGGYDCADACGGCCVSLSMPVLVTRVAEAIRASNPTVAATSYTLTGVDPPPEAKPPKPFI